MEDKRVEVNLSLLLNMRSMFQVISQRGAFKPEEFKIVGSVYDTLTAAIQPHIPKDQPLDDDTETVMAASENPEPISQNGTTETIMTPTEPTEPAKTKSKPKTPRSKKAKEPKEPKEV
jgi:hypothetical protein